MNMFGLKDIKLVHNENPWGKKTFLQSYFDNINNQQANKWLSTAFKNDIGCVLLAKNTK